MTTITGTIANPDLPRFENIDSQTACVITPEPAAYPQVPVSPNSPLFKLAALISGLFVKLFGPGSFTSDSEEETDGGYPISWSCCC